MENYFSTISDIREKMFNKFLKLENNDRAVAWANACFKLESALAHACYSNPETAAKIKARLQEDLNKL